MAVNVKTLETNPVKRILAKMFGVYTLTLKTGTQIHVEKGKCTYEGVLSPEEQYEYANALLLVG